MPEWLKSFIVNSIVFDKPGDQGGGGDEGERHTDAGKSGDGPKYSQSDLDDAVQKAIDKVVAKERSRSERSMKKAQDDAVEEWCQRNGVSESTLNEFVAWRDGREKEQTEAATELRATKRKLAELEQLAKKEAERANKYQGFHHERLTLGAIREAAIAANAINPDEVVAILERRVGLDEDEMVYVQDSNGKMVHGMTVDKMVSEYLTKNDHLVASRAPDGGGGSRTQRNAARANSESEKPQSIREILTEIAKEGVSLVD